MHMIVWLYRELTMNAMGELYYLVIDFNCKASATVPKMMPKNTSPMAIDEHVNNLFHNWLWVDVSISAGQKNRWLKSCYPWNLDIDFRSHFSISNPVQAFYTLRASGCIFVSYTMVVPWRRHEMRCAQLQLGIQYLCAIIFCVSSIPKAQNF